MENTNTKKFMTTPLQNVKGKIAKHLQEIAGYFNNAKVTVVIRTLDIKNGDLVMTDDDLDKVVEAIKVLKNRPKI